MHPIGPLLAGDLQIYDQDRYRPGHLQRPLKAPYNLPYWFLPKLFCNRLLITSTVMPFLISLNPKISMKVNTVHQSRTAQIWRSAGMIWLIWITAFFAMVDLYFAKLNLFDLTFTGIILLSITVFLFIWSMKMLNAAKELKNKVLIGDKTKRNSGKKWFIVILFLEVLALNVASFTLVILSRFEYIVPVDILIVAIHFIPLAHLFRMPVYYWLGAIVSVISVLTMIFISPSLHIGNLIEVAAIPSLSFIFLNWIVIIFILYDRVNVPRRILK